jgi:hypothetical protein
LRAAPIREPDVKPARPVRPMHKSPQMASYVLFAIAGVMMIYVDAGIAALEAKLTRLVTSSRA